MRTLLIHTDELLRGGGMFEPRSLAHRPAWLLPAIILVFGPIYGACMGTYGLTLNERLLQVLYSAVKVPLLLFATTAVCLPGFFVFNTLLGLRDDFRRALQAILAGQAGLSVVLASLAPLTCFFYVSTDDYDGAKMFNSFMFTVATLAGQIVMLRQYRALIHRDRRHRLMLAAWLAMYVFVGMQMGWMLRPFVGHPKMAVTFFRAEPFTNAYVTIFHLFFGR